MFMSTNHRHLLPATAPGASPAPPGAAAHRRPAALPRDRRRRLLRGVAAAGWEATGRPLRTQAR